MNKPQLLAEFYQPSCRQRSLPKDRAVQRDEIRVHLKRRHMWPRYAEDRSALAELVEEAVDTIMKLSYSCAYISNVQQCLRDRRGAYLNVIYYHD